MFTDKGQAAKRRPNFFSLFHFDVNLGATTR